MPLKLNNLHSLISDKRIYSYSPDMFNLKKDSELPGNFKPITTNSLINENSKLEVNIMLPNNSEHDYIGCIMGYSGTTINLIQKITNTDIKIEYLPLNEHIKITPKFKHKCIDENIRELNVAYTIIITIIKLKHTEKVSMSKYYILKEWQDNEKIIMVAVNNEIQKMINSKIDDNFINKFRLKLSITKLLKEKKLLNTNHDSDKLPIISNFIQYLDNNPDLSTITKKYEFNKVFIKHYENLFKEYFQIKNIIVRGSLIIDDYININFMNYNNFFVEIQNYEESSLDFSSKIIKKTSNPDIRPDSCIPRFDQSELEIDSESRPRTVSIYS